MPISFIELCAGIGGFRQALESLGAKCVYANDIDPTCKAIYDLNFDQPSLHIADVYDIDPHTLPPADLLVAGFPCQAFSIAGKQQGFDDRRGQVFFRIADIIQVVQPSMILLENVKNLQGHQKGETLQVIQQTLQELGYHLHIQVLNTMTHTNIPQNRERLFIVGFRDCRDFRTPRDFVFPSPRTEPLPSFQSFLEPHVDESFVYTDRFPMYPVLKEAITQSDTVYQWRRHHVRENEKTRCADLDT